MFGTFRKHSTWLWSIIIAATAVSMVIYFGPGNNSAGNTIGGRTKLGSIGGEPVTQEALNDAAAEARLQYFTSRGEWPGPDAERLGFDLTMESYKRLFVIQKQKELGIHISSEQVARVAANDLRALSQNGGQVSMAIFEANILKPNRLTLGDYERFLRHQLGMEQLIASVTTGSRLVTEQEARAIFERENRDRSVQAVFFSVSNHLAGISPTPEALMTYYSNQLARYRLPDRIQVSYVEFKATNHWAEAGADMATMTNSAGVAGVVRKYSLQRELANLPDLGAIVDAFYASRGTNFYADMSPEQARESIQNEFHEQLALRAASRLANDFADPILSADTLRVEALAERAKEKDVTVHVTPPFDRASLPEGMNVTEQFVKVAFALRDEEPIGGPVVTRDAVYLIAKNKEIPSEIQTYEEVRDKVVEDYRLSEALTAARGAADAFVAKATNAVAEGKAFASVCSEAKVTPVLLPPFSLNTRSLPEVEEHMSLQQFKQIAFNVPVGQVSPAVPIMEGAVVVYPQSELPLDTQKMAAELPEFIKMFRQARQQEAFEEWFNREGSRALIDTPVMQRPPEINPSGALN